MESDNVQDRLPDKLCLVVAARMRHAGMALRWCAAGMVEAGKQFHRVNSYLHLRSLRDTQERVTENVGDTRHDETINAA